MEDQLVWAGDGQKGYSLGKVVDIKANCLVVQLKNGKTTEVGHESVHYADDPKKGDVEDNCALMYLNEATLLDNVGRRYLADKIYTYTANILLAVNPYRELKDIYGKASIEKYKGKSLGSLPPHVFAVADHAYRQMKQSASSQAVIVSGESGAGKTETTKYMLNYLTSCWAGNSGAIEQKILESNPLLEAFGNAKTLRNNNSSRFGKFIELHFSNKDGWQLCEVAGAFISHYLLEKSRVCLQNPGERNYHIFYQLLAGADAATQKNLSLAPADHFQILKGCTQFFGSKSSALASAEMKKKGPLTDPSLDDAKDFTRTCAAMQHMGISETERGQIFAVLSGILHLGNVNFAEDHKSSQGGSAVTPQTKPSLEVASKHLGLAADELEEALTSRVMQPGRVTKGTVYKVPLKPIEAAHARDAFAKAIYSRLFDHIVSQVNSSLPFTSSSFYIGILDIAGFEFFEKNSFEQFCINYCNERLQQFFNKRVLAAEQELYRREGLNVKKIDFVDNSDCLELMERKTTGVFDLLDEQAKVPRPSEQSFTQRVHELNQKHFRLEVPRKSKIKHHRDIRDDEGFLIRHYAGAVCYQTENFLEKNNDALHASLQVLLEVSDSKFLQRLFPATEQLKTAKGKLTYDSVSAKFRSQLTALMEKLESTGTHFIRCLKPNSNMKPAEFHSLDILSQMQCSGMGSVLELMQHGYPSRAVFSDLYETYQKIMPETLRRLQPRMFCRALFKALGLSDVDFKFGQTKVFFRPGKFAQFDQLLRTDPEHLKELVKKVAVWLIRAKWKRAQYCVWEVVKLRRKLEYRRAALITIQSHTRRFVTRKRVTPIVKALAQLTRLQPRLTAAREALDSLKKKSGLEDKLAGLEQDVTSCRSRLKAIDRTAVAPAEQLTTRFESLLQEVQKTVHDEKKKKEEEKLKKAQEEMEKEKKVRANDARRKADEEDQLRQLQELEKRQREEARRQEAEVAAAATVTAAQLVAAEVEERRKKQDRADTELAQRLVTSDDQLAESANRTSAATFDKKDLSNWRYAQLRDTINTSTDLDVIAACREEFHRRLKVYNEWKSRNQQASSKGQEIPQSHMPETIGRAGANVNAESGAGEQRYFRIPFVRHVDGVQQQYGFWFGHFDGKWIARQIELHDGKKPILALSGIDDLSMCELSLAETGLIGRPGAEILEHQFEYEWRRHYGLEYLKNNAKKVSSENLRLMAAKLK